MKRRAQLAIRVRVWLRRETLIAALADGADSDAGAELTFVARELAGARSRQRLAAGLDRVLRTTLRPTAPWARVWRRHQKPISSVFAETCVMPRDPGIATGAAATNSKRRNNSRTAATA